MKNFRLRLRRGTDDASRQAGAIIVRRFDRLAIHEDAFVELVHDVLLGDVSEIAGDVERFLATGNGQTLFARLVKGAQAGFGDPCGRSAACPLLYPS